MSITKGCGILFSLQQTSYCVDACTDCQGMILVENPALHGLQESLQSLQSQVYASALFPPSNTQYHLLQGCIQSWTAEVLRDKPVHGLLWILFLLPVTLLEQGMPAGKYKFSLLLCWYAFCQCTQQNVYNSFAFSFFFFPFFVFCFVLFLFS